VGGEKGGQTSYRKKEAAFRGRGVVKAHMEERKKELFPAGRGPQLTENNVVESDQKEAKREEEHLL